MTTDDRSMEAALSAPRDDRPAGPGPERPRGGRAGRPTTPDGLADRPAVVAWNGLGCRPSRRRRLRARRAMPGPVARSIRPTSCRRAGPRDPAPPRGRSPHRIDLDLRGHTDFERDVWHKALDIPRGEVRPYGWIAAEIGRPKAVRAVGTALGHNPVPLSCRATASSGPTGRSASTRSVVRRTSGRSSRPRASTRPGWRRPPGAASGSSARHDPDRVLPTCWTGAHARPPPASVPLARRGGGGRPATGRAGTAGRSRRPRRLTGAARDRGGPSARTRPRGTGTLLASWTIHLCQRDARAPDGAPGLWLDAILILYVAWGSTYLGIRIAVASIPPFLMAALRFGSPALVLLVGRCPRGAVVPRPTRREWRDSLDRRRPADGWRDGHGRVGRADHPVGDHGAPHRDDAVWVAIFGGLFLGERLPRVASSGSPSASSASWSSSALRPRR